MAEWSSEKLEQLKSLWASGLFASQIGDALGFSKNAILGKVHRLKLPARREAFRQNNKSRKVKKKVKSAPRYVDHTNNPGKVALFPRCEKNVLSSIPESKKINLMQIGPHLCHYPTSVEPTLFCGHPAEEGKSYCQGHMRVCYLPARDRKNADRKAVYLSKRIAA